MREKRKLERESEREEEDWEKAMQLEWLTRNGEILREKILGILGRRDY